MTMGILRRDYFRRSDASTPWQPRLADPGRLLRYGCVRLWDEETQGLKLSQRKAGARPVECCVFRQQRSMKGSSRIVRVTVHYVNCAKAIGGLPA